MHKKIIFLLLVTSAVNHGMETEKHTSLYKLIESSQFEKAHTVITHSEKIDFGCSHNYLLKVLAESRKKTSDENIRSELLRITERLLCEKNMPADGKLPLTALMYAAAENDQPLAFLLLRYGANPYIKYHRFTGKNSFEYETGEPKGWLKRIVKSNNLFKYWAVKNYTFDEGNSLPQDIMQIIMRIRQQLHYHYERYAEHNDPLWTIIRERDKIKEQVDMDVSREFVQKYSTRYTDEYGEKWSKVPAGIIHKNGFIEDATISGFQTDIASFLEDHAEYNALLQKARKLLQKSFTPNFRHKNIDKTPLMIAIQNYDEKMTRLLLEFKANPYITVYNESTKETKNAFDFANQQMWFITMVDEMNTNKNNPKQQGNSCIKK